MKSIWYYTLKLFLVSMFLFMCFPKQSFAINYILQATAAQSYDSNVAMTTDESNEPVLHDTFTTINLGAGIDIERKTYRMRLIGRSIQQVYFFNSEYSNNAQDVNVTVTKNFNQEDRLDFYYAFLNVPEPNEYINMFGSSEGRISFYSHTINITAVKIISKRMYLTTIYNFQNYNYRTGGVDSTQAHRPSADLEYRLNSTNLFAIMYNYANMVYYPGVSYSINTPGARYRYYFTKQLYTEGRIGLDVISTSEKVSYYKPFFQLSLTKYINENSMSTFSFTKRYSLTGNSSNLLNNWRIQGEYSNQFAQRITVYGNIFYGNGDYIAEQAENSFFGLTLRGAYALTQHINLFAEYGLMVNNTETGSETFSYNRHRITIGARGEL